MQGKIKKISSSQNANIKRCVNLRVNKRCRNEHKRLLVIGRDIIQELKNLKVDVKIKSLFISREMDVNYALTLKAQNLYSVDDHLLQKLSGMKTVDSVQMVAEVDAPVWDDAKWKSSRVLALDGIQDPGNLGTLLRTCASLNWAPVLLLPNCCDPYNEKVLKAARGASFIVSTFKIAIEQIPSILEAKNLYPIAASSPSSSREGEDLNNVIERVKRVERGLCLFLGNEGQGLSQEVEKICQESFTIPLSNKMESLNVSVAGGILMYLLQSKHKFSNDAFTDA